MRVSPFLLIALLVGGCTTVPNLQSTTYWGGNYAVDTGAVPPTQPFEGYLPPMGPGVTPPAIRTDTMTWWYPVGPLRKGIQGCAWVKLDISGAGWPYNLHVLSSLPVADFGNAAISVLRQWRFVPARKNGHAIAVKGAVLPFVYSLGAAAPDVRTKNQSMPSACSSTLPPENSTDLPGSPQAD